MYVVNTHETHSIKTVNKRKDSNGIDRHGQRVPLRGSFRRQYHFAINKHPDNSNCGQGRTLVENISKGSVTIERIKCTTRIN